MIRSVGNANLIKQSLKRQLAAANGPFCHFLLHTTTLRGALFRCKTYITVCVTVERSQQFPIAGKIVEHRTAVCYKKNG
jgi:hypothetical protein